MHVSFLLSQSPGVTDWATGHCAAHLPYRLETAEFIITLYMLHVKQIHSPTPVFCDQKEALESKGSLGSVRKHKSD